MFLKIDDKFSVIFFGCTFHTIINGVSKEKKIYDVRINEVVKKCTRARDHSLITFAKVSEKLTFLNP